MPVRAGILRSGAARSLGRSPPGPDDRCAGDGVEDPDAGDGGEGFELPVSWDSAFWSQNYGRTVVFDLGVDARGVVRVALGERATPEVLEAVRKELIGQRLPLKLEEVAADATIWKRYRIELW